MAGRHKFLIKDTDKYGTIRYYVRRPGYRKIRIDGDYGSEDFLQDYHAALEITEQPVARKSGKRDPITRSNPRWRQNKKARKNFPEVSYVYIVSADEVGPVKVGISVDPRKRLPELQCGNPQELYIQYLVKTTGKLAPVFELKTLRALKDRRLMGEWVDVSVAIARDTLLQFVHSGPSAGPVGLTETLSSCNLEANAGAY